MEIPVYLFTGFLEAGKTKFIQETLQDKRFNNSERTTLVLCEEGIEEYDPTLFSGKNVFLHIVEEEQWLTIDHLSTLQKRDKSERVIIEYNGMWQLNNLFGNLPEGWVIAQEMMFADASTFLNYNANMRSLVVDKLQSCDIVIFNRCTPGFDKMPLHKIVRGVSRRADIAYDYTDGSTEYDDIEDPLPFDINADIIEIVDDDFALWYRDITEDSKKYVGKTVRFKGIIARDNKLPKDVFVIGRHIMTCCSDDIQYGGIVAVWSNAAQVKTRDWAVVTADIAFEYNKAYRGKGPVLHITGFEPATAPEQQVVTFY